MSGNSNRNRGTNLFNFTATATVGKTYREQLGTWSYTKNDKAQHEKIEKTITELNKSLTSINNGLNAWKTLNDNNNDSLGQSVSRPLHSNEHLVTAKTDIETMIATQKQYLQHYENAEKYVTSPAADKIFTVEFAPAYTDVNTAANDANNAFDQLAAKNSAVQTLVSNYLADRQDIPVIPVLVQKEIEACLKPYWTKDVDGTVVEVSVWFEIATVTASHDGRWTFTENKKPKSVNLAVYDMCRRCNGETRVHYIRAIAPLVPNATPGMAGRISRLPITESEFIKDWRRKIANASKRARVDFPVQCDDLDPSELVELNVTRTNERRPLLSMSNPRMTDVESTAIYKKRSRVQLGTRVYIANDIMTCSPWEPPPAETNIGIEARLWRYISTHRLDEIMSQISPLYNAVIDMAIEVAKNENEGIIGPDGLVMILPSELYEIQSNSTNAAVLNTYSMCSTDPTIYHPATRRAYIERALAVWTLDTTGKGRPEALITILDKMAKPLSFITFRSDAQVSDLKMLAARLSGNEPELAEFRKKKAEAAAAVAAAAAAAAAANATAKKKADDEAAAAAAANATAVPAGPVPTSGDVDSGAASFDRNQLGKKLDEFVSPESAIANELIVAKLGRVYTSMDTIDAAIQQPTLDPTYFNDIIGDNTRYWYEQMRALLAMYENHLNQDESDIADKIKRRINNYVEFLNRNAS